MEVDADVLGSLSLIVRTVSVDVKQHWTNVDANPDIFLPGCDCLCGFQTDSEMRGDAVMMCAVKGTALTKLSSVECSSKS